MESDTETVDIISRTVRNLDLQLVELNIGRPRGDVKVNIVLHKSGGISVDDLSAVQKILRPRLELEFGREKLSLEITSPGIHRKLKSNREYSIFKGQRVELFTAENNIKGIIIDSFDDSVELDSENGHISINFDAILKARLC